jgi:putative tricarboxylic transport membrane protein
MMDSNFRRAVSLASSTDNIILSMFGKPITIFLTIVTLIVILSNFPSIKRLFNKVKNVESK